MKTRVRELRTAAGMTQQQLADAVRVSSRTIISIEKGQYSPSLMLAYRMAGEAGPDHAKTFQAEVLLNGKILGGGSGHSKKEAEQAAARSALEVLGEE